jgi:uncharacterized protein involved in exopolysaccharide biosynthesis
LKRWYIVVAGLVIAGGLGAYVYSQIPPEYERSASVLLIPGEATIPEGGNPYLYLGGLGPASEVLLSTVNAPEIRDAILEDHPGADVVAYKNVTSSGPLISVTATAGSDATATRLVDEMLRTVPEQLDRLQTAAAVPDNARISSLVLGRDEESVIVQKTRLQLTAIAAAAVGILTIIIAGFIDALFDYRQRRSLVGATEPETAKKPKPVRDPLKSSLSTMKPARTARR